MKIGLMGGSFDPVHFGHLVAAQDALEQQGLDRLILVPAARAPQKVNETTAPGHHRVAMLQAATAPDHRLEVSDFEVQQGGISFTVNTARHFRDLFPQDDLYWILGADQIPWLDQWQSIAELVGLVEFIYLERRGHSTEIHPTTPGLKLHRCDGHLVDISSTALRERFRLGLSLDYFMPHQAIAYVQEHGLYS